MEAGEALVRDRDNVSHSAISRLWEKLMAGHATELRLQRDMLAQVLKALVAAHDRCSNGEAEHWYGYPLAQARQALKAVDQYQREARVMNSGAAICNFDPSSTALNPRPSPR
jgi:hypothetical protein